MTIDLDSVISFGSIVLIILGIYLLVEGIVIAIRVRKILGRVETMTDVSGWWSFLRRFPRFRKSQKDS